MESCVPPAPGRILYCTTGVLLTKLRSNPKLQGICTFTVFVRVDAAATINFRSSEVRCLFKGGYYSRAAFIRRLHQLGAGHTLAMQLKIAIAPFTGNAYVYFNIYFWQFYYCGR